MPVAARGMNAKAGNNNMEPETVRCEDCGELRALCRCTHEDWIDDVQILGLDKI